VWVMSDNEAQTHNNLSFFSSKIFFLSTKSESSHITLKPVFNQEENHTRLPFQIRDAIRMSHMVVSGGVFGEYGLDLG
jgi:hypothetical protein